MSWLIDAISDWLKQLLIDGILAKYSGLFDEINEQIGEIAVQVGSSPSDWNFNVFNTVKNLSETVVIPIAGIILTYVLCYELIQMVVTGNNFRDFDTAIFFKWILKTFIAVYILTNTFNITMAIFDVAQSIVNDAAGVIRGSIELGGDATLASIQTELEAMGVGELIGVYLETNIVGLCLWAMRLFIFVVVWGRMMEIYLTISLAPIPMSTMVNHQWGQIGNNYLKSLFALAFQGFLIMVCVAIYTALVTSIGSTDSLHGSIWSVAGYTALLCFILLKTGSISKSVFSSH